MSSDGSLCRAESSASDDSGEYNGPKFDFSSHLKDSESSHEGDDDDLKFDFSSHVKDSECKTEELCCQPAFLPYYHLYLPDMVDMPRCETSTLESGMQYRLPFYRHDGPCFPGQIVAIKDRSNGQRPLSEIFNRDSNYLGLIAVLGFPIRTCNGFTMQINKKFRGWVAQVLRLSNDGRYGLVQGVGFCTFLDWEPDSFTMALPVSILDDVNITFWRETCPTIAESDALFVLADKGLSIFRDNPRVEQFQGDPLQVSYWLASHMPLPSQERQRLFDEDPHTRLESIIELSSEYKRLQCGNCSREVADAKDLIQVVDQGPSLDCIDSVLGETISLMCFSSLAEDSARLLGEPQTCSWLPGYHQQCIYCSCGGELGWLLTAFEANMPIKKFWALRHVTVKPIFCCVSNPAGPE